jgi:hypothetical protein
VSRCRNGSSELSNAPRHLVADAEHRSKRESRPPFSASPRFAVTSARSYGFHLTVRFERICFLIEAADPLPTCR